MSIVEFQKIAQTEGIKKILSALDGVKVYLVGGAVRDLLLKKKSKDLDLAVAIDIQSCLTKLKSAKIKVFETGLQHDTLSAVPVGGEPAIEITAFRNGAVTIEGDLTCRDFTINALAFDFQNNTIIDPLFGRQDLKNKILKTCGKAYDRFSEDPLRLFRLVRFSASLGFAIDTKTFQDYPPLSWTTSRVSPLINQRLTRMESTLKDNIAKTNFALSNQVSVERKRDEFSKILSSARPSYGLRKVLEFGLLQDILPELLEFIGYEQNEFHIYDLFDHTLAVVENTLPFAASKNQDSILILRLAALLHDVGKPRTLSIDENGRRHFYCHEIVGINIAKNILQRLKYSNKIVQAVTMLVKTHMRPLNGGAGSLRRILRDTGAYYPEWRYLKEADAMACGATDCQIRKNLEVFDERIKQLIEQEQFSAQFKLAVNGYDIMKLGIPQGPQVGKILTELTDIVLNNPALNSKEELIKIIKK
ncbi:MAG: HD domain-containing protein [Deltaproteobacteria bacterium]|jgi:tRNA nucleotidyltransferase (CCA-adding enzyme)|nr:HD domain-containing protein [Deltaproteobacteria bacterium]